MYIDTKPIFEPTEPIKDFFTGGGSKNFLRVIKQCLILECDSLRYKNLYNYITIQKPLDYTKI